jgi:hypothetical protein
MFEPVGASGGRALVATGFPNSIEVGSSPNGVEQWT